MLWTIEEFTSKGTIVRLCFSSEKQKVILISYISVFEQNIHILHSFYEEDVCDYIVEELYLIFI